MPLVVKPVHVSIDHLDDGQYLVSMLEVMRVRPAEDGVGLDLMTTEPRRTELYLGSDYDQAQRVYIEKCRETFGTMT